MGRRKRASSCFGHSGVAKSKSRDCGRAGVRKEIKTTLGGGRKKKSSSPDAGGKETVTSVKKWSIGRKR